MASQSYFALKLTNICSHSRRTDGSAGRAILAHPDTRRRRQAGQSCVDLLRDGVIGNSPGSGPGIQGSSPCPAALHNGPVGAVARASRGGLLGPIAVEAPVRALTRDQLVVGALLDDAAAVEDDDAACLADR